MSWLGEHALPGVVASRAPWDIGVVGLMLGVGTSAPATGALKLLCVQGGEFTLKWLGVQGTC